MQMCIAETVFCNHRYAKLREMPKRRDPHQTAKCPKSLKQTGAPVRFGEATRSVIAAILAVNRNARALGSLSQNQLEPRFGICQPRQRGPLRAGSNEGPVWRSTSWSSLKGATNTSQRCGSIWPPRTQATHQGWQRQDLAALHNRKRLKVCILRFDVAQHSRPGFCVPNMCFPPAPSASHRSRAKATLGNMSSQTSMNPWLRKNKDRTRPGKAALQRSSLGTRH